MSTWLGVGSVVGAGSLDGFAVGVMTAGAFFLAITAPRRAQRRQITVAGAPRHLGAGPAGRLRRRATAPGPRGRRAAAPGFRGSPSAGDLPFPDSAPRCGRFPDGAFAEGRFPDSASPDAEPPAGEEHDLLLPGGLSRDGGRAGGIPSPGGAFPVGAPGGGGQHTPPSGASPRYDGPAGLPLPDVVSGGRPQHRQAGAPLPDVPAPDAEWLDPLPEVAAPGAPRDSGRPDPSFPGLAFPDDSFWPSKRPETRRLPRHAAPAAGLASKVNHLLAGLFGGRPLASGARG